LLAALALLVSIVGTIQANRRALASERLAVEARDEARAARTDALWSALVESIHGVVSLDPTTERVKDQWQRLRVTAVALVDGLPDWDGLDRWLSAEHALGAAIGRQVMEQSKPDDTADQRIAILKPSIDWAMALMNNVRLFRAQGHDAAAMQSLTDNAHDVARRLYARNGWDLPEPPAWQPLA